MTTRKPRRKAVPWAIWLVKADGERLHMSYQYAYNDLTPEAVLELWKKSVGGACHDVYVRDGGRWEARHYLSTALDNYGVGRGG